MNQKRIQLLAECIVNRTLGKDVKVKISDDWGDSCVNVSTNLYTNTLRPNHFVFGAYIMTTHSDDTYNYICSLYPIAKTVEPMMFAMLHEIGHTFAPANIQKNFNARYTMEEYRALPDEKFADTWAANFIKDNKDTMKIWNKHMKRALDE